jgi:hypothetical protein
LANRKRKLKNREHKGILRSGLKHNTNSYMYAQPPVTIALIDFISSLQWFEANCHLRTMPGINHKNEFLSQEWQK